MLRTATRAQNLFVRAPVSTPAVVPPPLSGWNVRDQLIEAPGSAIVLDNWYVDEGRVKLRDGFLEWATGLNGAAKTLMTFKSGTTERLFAATADSIYNVTGSGAVGAADVSSLSNGTWRYTMFATTSGDYLMCANGADGLRSYDGSSWATQTLTGLSAADVDSVTSHKDRLWFIKKNTLDAYYLGTFLITGSVTKFPIGAKASKGGFLVAIDTWTHDGGDGADDFLVFVTSEGEVILYQGITPGSDFAHVGTFQVDKPLGKRCTQKLGGDLMILTESGVLPVSRIFNMINTDDVVPETIRPAFEARAGVGRSFDGWQMLPYTNRGWLIVNVPAVSDTTSYQHVLDTQHNAWSRFTGMNALAWEVLDNKLFFSGTGTSIYQADTGKDDNGGARLGVMTLGWSTFNDPRLKDFKMIRAHLLATGEVKPTLDVAVDFDPDALSDATETSISVAGSTWDVDAWDVSTWGATRSVKTEWTGVTGLGYVGAIRMAVKTASQDIECAGFQLLYEPGAAV